MAKTSTNAKRHTALHLPEGVREETFPELIEPMHLQAAPEPFLDEEWSYEAKMDGYRLLAYVQPGRVRLITRGGVDYASYFPQICAALAENRVNMFIVDAEVVAFENGRPSFAALQRRANRRAAAFRNDPAGCVLFCFDILHVDGFNTRTLPYTVRRQLLSQVIQEGKRIQIVHSDGDGPAMYAAALELGMEGVVAKRKASIYQPGVRSPDWRKIKPTQTGKFVVLGYIPAGTGIGTLLVGNRNEDGILAYSGRISSGLSAAVSDQLLPLFRPAQTAPPYGKRFKRAVWVEPEVVIEARFFEFTDNHRLRHPVFSRIRTDMAPAALYTAPTQPAADESISQRADIAQQILGAAGAAQIEVNGATLTLTDLDQVLWPMVGRRKSITKRVLLHYLASVSHFMLRYLRDRPLAMVRPPAGRSEIAYERTLSMPLPDFIETRDRAPVKGEPKAPHVMCNNLQSLLWLANAGVVEFHVQHARYTDSGDGEHPDYLAFDLDPFIYSGREPAGGEPEFSKRAFKVCVSVALALKDVLDALGLRSFVKTTGKTGLHVFVPIAPTIDFDAARKIVEIIGAHVRSQDPAHVTMEWRIKDREGKIFIDHNMSGRSRTLFAAWSPRLSSGTISMPVKWEALPGVDPREFTVLSGSAWTDDPWTDLFDAPTDVAKGFNF